MNASDGLDVGRFKIHAAVFLRDGVEAVELHRFKRIIGGRLPHSITKPEKIAEINYNDQSG